MVSVAKIFNVTIPQRNGLCCAICKIVNCENDPTIYSNYCGSRLKCGQFLRQTPQTMAAPIVNRKLLESGCSLYIIVERDFFKSSIFQDHCDALNIQVVRVRRVLLSVAYIKIISFLEMNHSREIHVAQMDVCDPIPTCVYKACLLYTVEYRLAPQWNKVGFYLVEGRDFLSSTGSVHAITLNIKNIRDNSAQFHVEAVNLKIPFLRLNAARRLQHDLQPPVRVLPSLKMANVLSISKEIKENHLFKDYEDLRAYWENVHGYILPDYEEGLLFYDIEFYYFKSSVFVYPETCLISGPLEILSPTMDAVSRIYKFVGDLRGRVTKLCGQQLDICPENMYQAATLAYTPLSSKVDRFSVCDSGYGTLSRKTRNVISLRQMFNTCDIPTKRSRLSLPGMNNSLTCETEDDNFDLGISPTSSTSNFNKLFKTTDNISTVLYDEDNAMASKPIVQKNERKSHYFEQEQESESKSSTELANEEEKFDKASLKEKLLKNI
ncbi:uncharacterized protein C18orf63-like [Monomorium pharaonis]|uniref:uncharacterized protein C18orf63-like n=1 Tax=Monomorium pharaonis TaxID=307658 RepID=UPI0017464DF8|nr:uncharacterized protein C18orf63-like [Monomorium pharaonis]